MTKKEALEAATDAFGFNSSLELLEAATADSVVPGICLNCGYTEELEPDACDYDCPECKLPMLSSVLVIAEIL